MSRRTRSRNRYQSALNGGITNSATSFAVDSGAGLTEPAYMVIDPADPTKVEYIKVGDITGNTFSSVTRNLAGSVGAVAHDSGAVVRAVPVHQWIDDIFDDIEDLETFESSHQGSGGSNHAAATTSVAGFLSSTDKTKLDSLISSGTVTGGNSHDHNGGDGAQISHANLGSLTTGDPHTQYALETDVWSLVYPVGSIYISTVATNPATLFGGGTWAAFGTGRVLVGLDAGDTDFDVAEETGGAKTHTHTGPSHTHGGPSHTHTGPSHTHAISGTTTTNGSHDHGGNTDEANAIIGSGQAYTTGANEHIHAISNQAGHAHTFSDTSSAAGTGATGAGGTGNTDAGGTGATGSGSSVQPYIVVRFWKRTA